ncbi:rhodanese-like domain-containing protein [Roseiconus nitratireducens]|uniref:Rhodanese-like domain-containing protein n=1 Tax=Roseiconus nitratireducens TaxID=2605748 RepID=A0A5M6CZ80_9BACT|nr:rhodanese-like domain-containing protein [Roseiconus nitratireducens]KAA5540176.1 rhodanese-like domain-containing protein [Roseiconus nitratireducens]
MQHANEDANANGVSVSNDRGGTAPVVLVDVRTEAEWSVSKIPGSITEPEYCARKDDFRHRVVVPYCTIGGRSHLYTRRLIAQGIDARNYTESVVGWCQAGEPLVDATGQPTKRVHVYHRVFTVPGDYVSVS